MNNTQPPIQAPTFANAKTRMQKVRSAGMDPNYWYVAEYDKAIKPQQVAEITFWKMSIALFRDSQGALHAVENRCGHRQLKLSLGNVESDQLVCPYHGWGYGGTGKLESINHELFGKPMPNCKLKTYPVRVQYGLVWIFPGDAQLAKEVAIPEIPELTGQDPWACVPVDFTWQAHHSMIIDNVSDFTHAHLHRKYRPFEDATLTRCESVGDRVEVSYSTVVGGGKFSSLFVDRKQINSNTIDLCYEYPYQWSNTDDKIKHWCFVLPIDENTTRTFFLFYFDSFKIPFTPFMIPQGLMTWFLKISNVLLIKPLLSEDGYAVEAEQAAYETHFDYQGIELNPAVLAFQKLTIRKWKAAQLGSKKQVEAEAVKPAAAQPATIR